MSRTLIFFRCDSSNIIGHGHFVRCYALALALQSLSDSISIEFISKSLSKEQIELLKKSAMKPVFISQDQESWEILKHRKGDSILIVDNYDMSPRISPLAKLYAKKVVIIDDSIPQKLICDLYLNPNYTKFTEREYRNELTEAQKVLIGPKYALLRKEFHDYRINSAKKIRNKIRSIFINFGGSDPHNYTLDVAKVLYALQSQEMNFNFVFGRNHSQIPHIETLFKECSSARILIQPPNIVEIMANADLAIVAGGGTVWELCCMGTPLVVVSQANNQVDACVRLASDGYIKYLGNYDSLTQTQLKSELVEIIKNPSSVFNLGAKGSTLVDGLGTSRVAKAILEI